MRGGVGKVPIREGNSLGLEYEPGSNPLVVASVDPESYLAGIIRKGYKVHGLMLEDQTKFEGLDEMLLEEKLIATYSETGRRLLVQMGFVDTFVAHIKNGEKPFIFKSSPHGTLILDKILDEDLRKQLRTGMSVAEIHIEDIGLRITSPSVADLDLEAGIDSDYSLTLTDPAKKVPAHEKILPSKYTIDLPIETDLKLNLADSKDGILVLKGVEDDSFFYPMGNILSGMIVETLAVENFQFQGLGKMQLSQTLEETANVEGRKLILKSFVLPGESTPSFRVPLPKGDVGLEVSGEPLTISRVADNSPLNGLVFEGQVILGFVDATGVEYQDMEDFEFEQLLLDTNDIDDRAIIVKNNEEYAKDTDYAKDTNDFDPGSNGRKSRSQPSETKAEFYSSAAYPNGVAIRLSLPSGSFGVRFSGSPAFISAIDEESPFRGILKIGQQVLSLAQSDGTEYENMADYDVQQFLLGTEGTEGRVMVVAHPGMRGDFDIDLLPKIDVSSKEDLPY